MKPILISIYLQLSAICIGLTLYSIIVVENQLSELLQTPDGFADFTSLGDTTKNTNSMIAVTVFFAWIKMFKYISFNKTMTQLSSTLSRVWYSHILNFMIEIWSFFLFIVCCWCHGIWSHVCNCIFCFCSAWLSTFWNSSTYLCVLTSYFLPSVQFSTFIMFILQVKAFSNFDDAVFTLLRTILGDFDFHAIESANRFLGPIYFLSYVFFVFFVLLVRTEIQSFMKSMIIFIP